MRVLIVENAPGTHLGQVGVALAEAGAELELRRPRSGDAIPDDSKGFDALVAFGGEQNALDDALHPYLPSLAALMRAFDVEDKPVLGICLGSQVLARAHGGRNIIGAAREFGWHHVELTEQAADDPVLGQVARQFPIFQWHSDTFTLPPGAVRLASNAAVENQCFRIGRASYGMQFHFEASRAVVDAWNSEFPDVVSTNRPGWLEDYPHLAGLHADQADAAGLLIARAWVDLLRR
jgi:GMP synthase (glutamine-hydrolysing)